MAKGFWAPAALILALAACDAADVEAGRSAVAEGPQLAAPAPEAEPARRFQPSSDAARAATGIVTVSVTMRMPQGGSDPGGEVLTLRAANGLVVEARLVGSIAAAATIAGQPLRALAGLPVEASQALLYEINQEGGGASLCGGARATHLVYWEAPAPGAEGLRMLPFSGGAPASAEAAPCTALEYARVEGG
ncbi:MAG: hypothetical protein GC189_10160 [Alphaproteobacteria bacterium]|nr:hypothetical protein [Alphaproteobacteria bacterium]